MAPLAWIVISGDLLGPRGVPEDMRGPETPAESRPLAGRTVFLYSVIPGGVYSADELTESVSTDSPVAAHYQTVSLHAIRPETVKTDRWAYMSYRVGDQIFWTKRKLLLRHGEKILTDGTVEIRSRCGNRISLQPVGPTADPEPGPMQFDALISEDPADPGLAGGPQHTDRTAAPFEPATPIATPEPGTLILVGGGVAMMLGLRRRGKHTRRITS
jgi:hypothetical protein